MKSTSQNIQTDDDEYLTIRECVQRYRAPEKPLRMAAESGAVESVMTPDFKRRIGSWDRPVLHVSRDSMIAWLMQYRKGMVI